MRYFERKVWWAMKKQRRSQRWERSAVREGGSSSSGSTQCPSESVKIRTDRGEKSESIPEACRSGSSMRGCKRVRIQ